jgi:hypothetical protein
MVSNRLSKLTNRAKALYETISLTLEEIYYVQAKLNVELPDDFKKLCISCSYEISYPFDFLNFGTDDGVIGETQYYRKNYSLPDNYMILSQQDDVSFVLLKAISVDKSEVIWCDYQDFFNLCNSKSFQYNPTIFPTFTDFYEFLLDEEEKMRAEENND